MPQHIEYRGRFAPSPTGPLHFGSLVAAVGSFLQARSQNGQWLLRIEDLDPPREEPEATDSILHTLEHFGFEWDGAVIYQSQRMEAYISALEQLQQQGSLYPCSCSRKEIAAASLSGHYGPVYSGLCRSGPTNNRLPLALRVLTHDKPIHFTDLIRGTFEQYIESEIGDFIVRRADSLFAYQLAVVVDDAEQQITEVVRGSDLLDNTPRQIHLQQLLGVTTPRYAHLPIALNKEGQKLSKQRGAESVHRQHPQHLLVKALSFLGQKPPVDLVEAELEAIWTWAIKHWDLTQIPHHDLPAPLIQP